MSSNKKEKSSGDPVEELNEILNDVEQNGEEIADAGREITGRGQYFVDIARATKGVVQYLPPNAIENLIEDWKPFAQHSERILIGLQGLTNEVISDTDAFAGTASLSSTGTFSYNNPYVSSEYVVKHPEAKEAIDYLHSVAGRYGDAVRVEELLQKFGFDKAPKGKKSPLELFRTAHNAFEKPVIKEDPTITSLLPIRECIHLVLAELLKHRPMQEKTGNDYIKVMSIGKQLKRDSIPMETIESLARKWHEEIRDKELTASKEHNIDRKEWSVRLQRATQFLFSLLSGLDSSKMRND